MSCLVITLSLLILLRGTPCAQEDLRGSNANLPTEPAGAQRTDSLSAGDNDFVFDLPDVVVPYKSTWGEIQLEAYRARENSAILNSGDPQSKRSRLYWVSVGYPSFIKSESVDEEDYVDAGELADENGSSHEKKTQGPDEKKLFHFLPDVVYGYVETLTNQQRGQKRTLLLWTNRASLSSL
jgi:hypothetical protein